MREDGVRWLSIIALTILLSGCLGSPRVEHWQSQCSWLQRFRRVNTSLLCRKPSEAKAQAPQAARPRGPFLSLEPQWGRQRWPSSDFWQWWQSWFWEQWFWRWRWQSWWSWPGNPGNGEGTQGGLEGLQEEAMVGEALDQGLDQDLGLAGP